MLIDRKVEVKQCPLCNRVKRGEEWITDYDLLSKLRMVECDIRISLKEWCPECRERYKGGNFVYPCLA